MKRITVLLLVCAFVLGGIGVARADGIDIKVKGQWDFAFGWMVNRGFKNSVNGMARNGGGPDNDTFTARQRVRTQINFISSEYLQAVLMFEIGSMDWGRPGTTGRGSGSGLDADGVNIETKRAYLDWMIPETSVSVRMGLQYLALPGTTMRNPVFGADVAGIVISSPITDWLAATAFWIRPFDNYRNGDNEGNGARPFDNNVSDAVDVFGLVLPITMDGWSLTPYFLYGWVGAQSGLYEYVFVNASNNAPQQQLVTADDSRAKAWWLGTNFDLTMFDPFRFQLDVIYGHLNRADVQPYGSWVNGSWINRNNGNWTDFNTNWGTEGWYIGAVLDYKLDFMTPGIFGWWASGDSKSDYEEGMLGRLPVVGIDDGWGMNSFGNVGFYYNNHDENAVTSWTGVGTWGIGIQLADITFIENLSHTIRLSYYRGTNDPDIVKDYGNAPGPGGAAINAAPFKYAIDPLYMTSNDYAWEVNFDHKYQIYENLTAVLELGYIRLHSDRDTWQNYASGDKENDNAWKAELMFRYSF